MAFTCHFSLCHAWTGRVVQGWVRAAFPVFHERLKLTSTESVTKGNTTRERTSHYDGATSVRKSMDTRKLGGCSLIYTQKKDASGRVIEDTLQPVGMLWQDVSALKPDGGARIIPLAFSGSRRRQRGIPQPKRLNGEQYCCPCPASRRRCLRRAVGCPRRGN
jgi:hypothetical protein